ncbi:MAG: hypothetical protein JO272_02600 [Pseudonocardiales bacterium]|nr:hypothetical protein [Pseudonocardiales bacterium]
MLDVDLILEQTDDVAKRLATKGTDPAMVYRAREAILRRRELRSQLDEARAVMNRQSKEMGRLLAAKDPTVTTRRATLASRCCAVMEPGCCARWCPGAWICTATPTKSWSCRTWFARKPPPAPGTSSSSPTTCTTPPWTTCGWCPPVRGTSPGCTATRSSTSRTYRAGT